MGFWVNAVTVSNDALRLDIGCSFGSHIERESLQLQVQERIKTQRTEMCHSGQDNTLV